MSLSSDAAGPLRRLYRVVRGRFHGANASLFDRIDPLCARNARPLFEPLQPRLLLSANSGAEQAIEIFGTNPALFIANQGQWDESVRFAHMGQGANIALTDSGPVFDLFREVSGTEDGDASAAGLTDIGPDMAMLETEALRFSVSFDGANAVVPIGLDEAPTRFNFYVGQESRHRSNVAGYEVVAYEGLYDGIDLRTWGRRSNLKYEFHVAPEADYRQIAVSYSGIDGLSIADDGTLAVDLGEDWAGIIDDAPYIYQVVDGHEVEVPGEFLLTDADTYTFRLTGPYDATRELIIDPELAWSTYVGGSNSEWGYGIAVDGEGNILATGYTGSSGWVSGGFDTSFGGGFDAFVAKLSPSGGHIWSTYLGGDDLDAGYGIAVDASGNVLVTGETFSSGWVSGGWDTSHSGVYGDGFVVKLDPSGGHVWSSYLGGSNYDWGSGIAADASGNVLVTGATGSSWWVSGGFDTSYNGGQNDAFVAKLSSSGDHIWSTYLGGGDDDQGRGIAADASGNALVTGYTKSSGWTSGGFDTTLNGGKDAFVAKISSSGDHIWSTYLGGGVDDQGRGIAVDAGGDVLVTGTTSSPGWVSGGFDTSYNGGEDAFVAKLSSSGGHAWSTYLGGQRLGPRRHRGRCGRRPGGGEDHVTRVGLRRLGHELQWWL